MGKELLIITEGRLREFTGFAEEDEFQENQVFVFDNGEQWQQDESYYYYYGTLKPKARVIQYGEAYYLIVDATPDEINRILPRPVKVKRYVSVSPFDLIGFDTSDLVWVRDDDKDRLWHTPENDSLFLHHLSAPPAPGITCVLDDIDGIRQIFRLFFHERGGGIGRVDVASIDGCQTVIIIAKKPQEPTGMMYYGLLIIPFRDFCYVISVGCREYGTTGIRDTFVSRQYRINENGGTDWWGDWFQDPYDPSFKGKIMWNKSEDEQFDDHFPDHPLSRLRRRRMRRLEASLTLADSIKQSPPFTGKVAQ